MAIRFQCPNCKHVQALHSRLIGREVRCPKCAQPIQIPTQEELDAAREERELTRRLQAARVQQHSQPEVAFPTSQDERAVSKSVSSDEDEEAFDESPIERRELPHDHIDMTPMVDITFLLLIFFMSTANFTLQKSMEVPVQKESQASTNAVPVPEDVHDSVTVQIDEYNAYTILMGDGTEREAPSKQDLIASLEEARLSAGGVTPPEKLVIEAHRDCSHAAVISALDAGRDREFTTFRVTVVEEFD